MNIWEDKIKDIADFRTGCYEKGQGARQVRLGFGALVKQPSWSTELCKSIGKSV